MKGERTLQMKWNLGLESVFGVYVELLSKLGLTKRLLRVDTVPLIGE